MALAYQEHYLIEDYEQWEGDWELIDGMPYAMSPAPVTEHQYIGSMIVGILNEKLEECEACYAVAEAEWRAREDTVFRPDVMVVCSREMERYNTKRPEMIFEVVSPATAKRDEHYKFDYYEAEGVPWYTIVYPSLLIAKIYRNVDGTFKKAGECKDETFVYETPCGEVAVDFGRVFKRLRRQR
ncbi:Uma2 family endonuclease [Hydrogenimonas sp.]|uniref:Uma2 family endonuclease n=1 Tax=Hydrogenimonas sp. TaxID=2231112 RepID=UPI00260703B6|nr:Uma2 family endonuclease [Hydrogenimonas sp.]